MKPNSTSKSGRSGRPGVTIIELMIAVTGVTMMMTLCAVSIQLLMKLNTDVQGRYSAAVTLERLASQLRDDAHASETARITADPKAAGKPAGLLLALEPDHTVTYVAGDGGMVRTESRAGKVIRHEAYRLAHGEVGHFEIRDEGSRKLVALIVTHTAGKRQIEPPRSLEVVAIQGKDRLRPLTKTGGKAP